MRFDTRTKKPALWNILIQVIFVLAIVVLLVQRDARRYSALACVLLAVFVLAAVIQLLAAFRGQLQYNPYSYNTVYYLGFALFLVFLFITLADLAVHILQSPDVYRPVEILHRLLGSSKTYMYLTFPFLVLFCLGLCVSNLSLIRHEGFRPVNGLGIVLSFLIVAGTVFLFRYDYAVSGSMQEVMIHDLLGNLFAAVYLYYECMLVGTIAGGVLTARYEPDPDRDFVIIPGCGMRVDGTPTPLLRGRLERALAFRSRQLQETGKDLYFIPSGGQGPDEIIPESTCMKNWLLQNGVPEERIIEENRSTTTMENMQFSKEKIMAVDPEGKIAFATSNYHVFRSGLCARRVKMKAAGMGAPTKWYFWPNAAVREFAGLLKEHRGKQALIIGGIIAAHVILTMMVYL